MCISQYKKQNNIIETKKEKYFHKKQERNPVRSHLFTLGTIGFTKSETTLKFCFNTSTIIPI